jgi:hypothetical protein
VDLRAVLDVVVKRKISAVAGNRTLEPRSSSHPSKTHEQVRKHRDALSEILTGYLPNTIQMR